MRILAAPIVIASNEIKSLAYRSLSDAKRLSSIKDSRSGKACLIVGNGPSLRLDDLEMLASIDSFASNGIVRMFGETVWRPTYYVVFDHEYIAHEASSIARLELPHIFIDWTPSSEMLRGRENVILLNGGKSRYSTKRYTTDNIAFSHAVDKRIYSGHTVTYISLQLALWMGYSQIYLTGMDHTFRRVVDSNGLIHSDSSVIDHAFDDRSGTHVNPQYKEGVEYAYRLARCEAEARGIHIYNATRGGSLEVFERVDLDEVLSGIGGESDAR